MQNVKICAISDSHSKHDSVIIPHCDILMHAGDITFFSKKGPQEVVDFLDWFYRQPAKYKIFCAGNHDLDLENDEALFRSIMPPGVIYLNDELVEIEGIKIWGSPITPTFYNWAFNRDRGAKIKKHWSKIPEGIDILLTHGPAYGHLDLVGTESVGCVDLLEVINKIKPSIHIFGHIHRHSHKTIEIDGKKMDFYNAAVVNSKYEIIHKPHVFDFN